ncbi:hypothetical protein COLO4_38013 [Corchorus olitorius]|uniref:Uncharacterized protein n=1 Tax=Corchorus olitorius TaxID=93759 RepID=A0A1R3FXL0_9ROSI|nr:hypothetical protein COLO4_38013 [Corchorus olitorius]
MAKILSCDDENDRKHASNIDSSSNGESEDEKAGQEKKRAGEGYNADNERIESRIEV